MKTILLAFLVVAVAGTARGDELGALLKELKAPARFAEHKARFRVEQREFTFQQLNGPEQQQFWVIQDGDRYVGVMPFKGFHGGTFYLLTHDPAQAPTVLPMPTERWHIDTAIGTALRTDHWLPSKDWGAEGEVSKWEVGEGGATLTLTRRFKGAASYNKWEDNRKNVAVDHTGTFVLRVDPVLGYVIDAKWDTASNPAPAKSQVCSLMPAGLSDPWPDREPGARVVTCPRGKTGYVGYAQNHVAIASGNDRVLGGCRDGGFAAYLNLKTGWSPALSLFGGEAGYSVCNVHADLDFEVVWPKELPEENGLKRFVVRTRLCRLPPEVTRHVWDKMEMTLDNMSRLIIAIGAPEDFEGEPSRSDTTKRGMTFTGQGPPIVEGDARSGTKAMQVRGTVWPNLPQLVLKPNTRYRMSAWFKVMPATAEQKQAIRDAWPKRVADMRRAHEKKMERLKKEGKESEITEFKEPVFEEPGVAEGYMTGHYYEWTPHSGQWVVEQTSNKIKEGEGWQEAVIEFTTPAWGPFIDPRFLCTNGGTALVDDFLLVEVK